MMEAIVKKIPEINPTWLLTGEGKMLKNIAFEENSDTSNQQGIPFFELRAEAGFPGNGIDGKISPDAYYRLPDDFKGDNVFVTDVWGDSMSPQYNSGDKIICRLIDSLTFIQWGRAYVIDTFSQGILLKTLRVADQEDAVKCVSENKEKYDPFLLPKKEIKKIALVLALLRKEG
ncbi:S24 family peptidase [Algivirga pacifica]